MFVVIYTQLVRELYKESLVIITALFAKPSTTTFTPMGIHIPGVIPTNLTKAL